MKRILSLFLTVLVAMGFSIPHTKAAEEKGIELGGKC